MGNEAQESDDLERARARIAELEREVRDAKTIFKAAPAFIAHIRLDGSFFQLNQFAAGYSGEQLRDRTIFDFTEPQHRARMRACLEQVIATKAPDGFASIAAGADGRPTHYYTRLAPILEGGEVESIALIATDVSPAVRALEESETKLRLVLEASRMGTWTIDPTTHEMMAVGDARALAIVGDPRAQARAPALSRVHPDDLVRAQTAISQVLSSEGPHGPYELRLVHVDGSIKWIHAFGTASRTPDGAVRLVGGILDVTELRHLEETLAQTEKLDSIGRLAGGIAHDFNNMLTAILSYTELALGGVEPDSQTASDLHEIRHAAERSAALTKQLLAFARKQPFSPHSLDPNELVLDVDKLLRRLLGEDIELVTVLEATSLVSVDRHQIEQVLVNLATNARHAMKGGGRFTLVTSDAVVDDVDAERLAMLPGPVVKMTATDTGEGMSPEQAEHVFEPFFTTKEVGLGTGLGLATSYGVVRKHRGAITVRSASGHGATFDIYLPAAEPRTEVREPQAEERMTGLAGSESVLVVEDEPLVRAVVCKTLRRQGYEVLEAANGSEALELARRRARPADLLLTDAVMPHMSGLQLADQLVEIWPRIRVIIMSGYTEDANTRAFDFVAKPFLPNQMERKVREVLDRSWASRRPDR